MADRVNKAMNKNMRYPLAALQNDAFFGRQGRVGTGPEYCQGVADAVISQRMRRDPRSNGVFPPIN